MKNRIKKVMSAKDGWEIVSNDYPRYRTLNDYTELPVVKKLLKNIKGKKVLDAGCGIGTYCILTRKKGAKVIGVDLTENMIRLSNLAAEKNKLDIDFRVMDITKLKFKEETFDIVLCMGMIDVVKDYKKAISELSRVLKSGGKLIFSIWHPWIGSWEIENGKPTYYKIENYFATGTNNEFWDSESKGPLMVEAYHRTLGDFSSALTKSGFLIKSIHEPKPSKTYKKIDSEWYTKSNKIPYFIIIEAIKLEGKDQ
ncbi:MAG: class I SAM-dependent methyltransferase [Nanoarchaeota archaeon]|nr:class I SAM-dependent methyltransferase [Nanoarchaeota archaeon]